MSPGKREGCDRQSLAACRNLPYVNRTSIQHLPYCRYCEEYAAGNGQNQYNSKLDSAEEEVNYCTDSACTNYLDTCEEKEYYDYNELCDDFEILVFDNYK